jgi:hypothetical protein
MPLWVWIVLTVAAMLAVGWAYDHKRKPTRGLERPASTGHRPGPTAPEPRYQGGGVDPNSGGVI